MIMTKRAKNAKKKKYVGVGRSLLAQWIVKESSLKVTSFATLELRV